MQFTRTKERPALYCRVSSEEQRERQSILTQVEFGQSYARLHEMEFAEVYRDDGVSGTIPLEDRPEGARLLADARAGRVRSVYVYRLDRVGRDPRGVLNAVAALDDAGCTVVSMTEPFDTESPAGRFMLSMLAAVAGFERDSFIARSREGRDRKARDGYWVGGRAPYGYQRTGEAHERRIEPDETPIPGTVPPISPAGVIRLMYRLCAEDGLPCQQIVDHLNACGIPTPSATYGDLGERRGRTGRPISGQWSPAAVAHYLTTTTYKGLHVHGRWKGRRDPSIERPVPALVDAGTWERAQAVLQSNRWFPPGKERIRYQLSALLRCGHCGYAYVGSSTRAHNRSYRYYVCEGKQLRPTPTGCTLPRLVAQDAEASVWQRVQALMADPGEELRRLAARLEPSPNDADELRRQLARCAARRDELQTERGRVVALYRRGKIDDLTADQELQEIEREERMLDSEQERLTARLRAQPEDRSLEHALEMILAARELSEQREIIRHLVKEIIVRPERELEIRWRFWAG